MRNSARGKAWEVDMANVKHLCIGEPRGELKRPAGTAYFRANYGMEDDAHAGGWHRQVSLLAEEDIKALGQANVRPGAFSENIVLSGLGFSELGLGTTVRLGNSVILSVTQTGKAVYPSENIVRLNGDNIMARSGLFARVEQGGEVRVGDEVKLLNMVPRDRFQAVVITVSDRCSRGETVDTAGPAVVGLLQNSLDAHIYRTEIVPDDKQTIMGRLEHYSDGHSIDLIVTVGGTGPAPRDITPEATQAVVERSTPGFDEAMRYASLAKTPTAMLSRGASGIRQSTLLINLPGSQRAAVENLEVILAALPHGLVKLRGHPGDCACCRERIAATKKAVAAGG